MCLKPNYLEVKGHQNQFAAWCTKVIVRLKYSIPIENAIKYEVDAFITMISIKKVIEPST